KGEDREGPGLLEINDPGEFLWTWPSAEVFHEIIRPATHRLRPSGCFLGNGVEITVEDIFTSFNFTFLNLNDTALDKQFRPRYVAAVVNGLGCVRRRLSLVHRIRRYSRPPRSPR